MGYKGAKGKISRQMSKADNVKSPPIGQGEKLVPQPQKEQSSQYPHASDRAPTDVNSFSLLVTEPVCLFPHTTAVTSSCLVGDACLLF